MRAGGVEFQRCAFVCFHGLLSFSCSPPVHTRTSLVLYFMELFPMEFRLKSSYGKGSWLRWVWVRDWKNQVFKTCELWEAINNLSSRRVAKMYQVWESQWISSKCDNCSELCSIYSCLFFWSISKQGTISCFLYFLVCVVGEGRCKIFILKFKIEHNTYTLFILNLGLVTPLL